MPDIGMESSVAPDYVKEPTFAASQLRRGKLEGYRAATRRVEAD
jgi:hypothetical protein